jgi:hypothetical protein
VVIPGTCRCNSSAFLNSGVSSFLAGQTHFQLTHLGDTMPPIKLGHVIENSLIMKTGFENCKRSHRKCHEDAKPFVPSRLLRVDCLDGKVRLITSEMLRKIESTPRYMTLSHCWGNSRYHFTTMRQSLENRMAGILCIDLPRTYREAVSVTRGLGISFLWIDSLCIVQDDEVDWAKESALMSATYGGSYGTLAALSSPDSEGGCRIVPDIQKSTEKCVDIDFQE